VKNKHRRQEIILGRLLLGEVINTSSLAKQFGVSDRTVLNDINELKLAHDIVSPKKGFYKLKKIPTFMISENRDILENLIFSLAYNSFVDFRDEISVMYKNELLFDFDTEFENIKNLNDFKLLLQSLKWNYSLEINYENDTKTIHPLRIANYQYYWYLIAYDLRDEKIKTFLINKIQNLCMLYENLYGDVTELKKNLKKTPWVKEEIRSVELKIYPPYKDSVSRRIPVNCELIDNNKKYATIRMFYYTEEEALNFIKKYLPNIEILDEELNQKLKNLLQKFLIRN